MTIWTSELESLIREFSEHEEQNTIDGCDADMPLELSLSRIAFRSATQSQPLYTQICNAMGLLPDYQSAYTENLQKMIDLAVGNENDAADKLTKKLAFTQELNQRFKGVGGIERIKAAKRGEITYTP